MASFKLCRCEGSRTSLFCLLPLHLARWISVFLPAQVFADGEQLVRLLEFYPLPYLAVALSLPESRRAFDNFAKALEADRSISLDVSLTDLQGSFAGPFFKLIVHSDVVEAFTVRDCNVPFEVLKDISSMVAESRNQYHSFHFGFKLTTPSALEKAAESIAGLVLRDKSLCCLDLRRSGLELPLPLLASCGLLGALKDTTCLRYIRLLEAGLDPEGAELLANALATNKSIEYVDLGENLIKDRGVLALAKTVETSTSLRALKLPAVGMSCKGGEALAQALCKNQSLQALHLKDDCLGPKCGHAFANMLKVNTSLLFLCLDFCDLEAKGCRSFINALSVNRTLEVLRLNFNGITSEDQEDLRLKATEGGVLKGLEVADWNLLGTQGTKSYKHDVAHKFDLWNTSYATHLVSRTTGKTRI